MVEKYNELMNNLDCSDGILFMVDLFGGSPFNAASMIAMKNNNVEIVTGVNLPMILEVLGNRNFSSLPELLTIAENSGKEAIKVFVKDIHIDEEDEL